MSLAGLAAMAAFYRLRPKGEDPLVRRALWVDLTHAPWNERRAFAVGLVTTALTPWRGDQDLTAAGSASAGASQARAAMALAAAGRLALAGVLLLAALFTRSAGLCLLGLAGLFAAGMTLRLGRSPRARSLARLGCAWIVAGLGPVGLARVGDFGTLVLAPWGPAVDAVVYVVVGIGLRTLGLSLPYFLLPAAGLAGAGWLGTQAALGLLAGGHLGATLALARLGRRERDEGRVAAFGLAITRSAQGLLVLLGTLATLPLLAHSTGSPIAVTLALFLWEVCSWAAVTGASHAAASSLDEALRVHLPEGQRTGVPSLRATPLVVTGIAWRAQRLAGLTERMFRPRAEALSTFKIKQWSEEGLQLMSELDRLRDRASNRPLHHEEEHALASSLRSAARSRDQIHSWIATYGTPPAVGAPQGGPGGISSAARHFG